MSQLVKGVSPGTESQQMHMSSEHYSRAVVKAQVKCSQWEPVSSVCLSLLFCIRIWCSRPTRIYTMIQHFLSYQNSCFAALLGVGDHHYRYLDAKKKLNMGKNLGFPFTSSHAQHQCCLKKNRCPPTLLKHSLAVGSESR